MKPSPFRRIALVTGATLFIGCAAHAGNLSTNSSQASAASMVAVGSAAGASIAVPALLLSGAASLTVVAVEASAQGTVWVLERASDGARASLPVAANVVGGLSVATGTVLTVTALGTGWVLSTAGRAVAFIANESGAALFHNERITP